MSAYSLHVHLLCYPLYVHLSSFTFIEGFLFSEYDVGCFYSYPYVFTHASMVAHVQDPYYMFHSHGLYM